MQAIMYWSSIVLEIKAGGGVAGTTRARVRISNPMANPFIVTRITLKRHWKTLQEIKDLLGMNAELGAEPKRAKTV
jgi:hypothetical protein